jgi:hypothetical protein
MSDGVFVHAGNPAAAAHGAAGEERVITTDSGVYFIHQIGGSAVTEYDGVTDDERNKVPPMAEEDNTMQDRSHDDEDYNPEQPDLQHEQPPIESTDDAEDFEPDNGTVEDDSGELPEEIPDAE